MKSVNRLPLLLLLAAATILFSSGCARTDALSEFGGDPAKPLKFPEASAKRPKIVALGDSLTAGFGLTETESMPYLLQQRLQAEGFDFEVVNAGVSGDTSLGGLERADWVLDQENVRILILELGGNDLLRRMPVDAMVKNLSQIIEKAKARGVEVLLCGMLAPPGVGSEYQREFQMAFPDLAAEHGVPFLPFLLEGVALKKELNQADGIHPNAEGSKLMTENVYRAVRPIVEKVAAAD
jgi:acyl-CoA thioesterase-1